MSESTKLERVGICCTKAKAFFNDKNIQKNFHFHGQGKEALMHVQKGQRFSCLNVATILAFPLSLPLQISMVFFIEVVEDAVLWPMLEKVPVARLINF